MNNITDFTADGFEIKSSWGQQRVITKATVIIQHTDSHKESYTINFSRDQITARITEIECEQREETTTTEHTLSREAVEDLCTDYLNEV